MSVNSLTHTKTAVIKHVQDKYLENGEEGKEA
jgi:hypothetical protein